MNDDEDTRDRTVLTKTAPERIYLQVSEDEDHHCEPFPRHPHGDEITWCQDPVLACEVEYVRADLASPAQGWRPIDSAPKDGRHIIVPGGIAYWRERLNHWEPPSGWYTITGFDWPGRPIQWEVLDWMPMPDSPPGYRPAPPPPAGESNNG